MRHFGEVYEQAVRDVVPYLDADTLNRLGAHNPGWKADRFDAIGYLNTSKARYQRTLDIYDQQQGKPIPGLRFLDVGGFLGAFPLALARLGANDNR